MDKYQLIPNNGIPGNTGHSHNNLMLLHSRKFSINGILELNDNLHNSPQVLDGYYNKTSTHRELLSNLCPYYILSMYTEHVH